MFELSDETVVEPVQHVPGPLNPADIPTRACTTPDEVRESSIWQSGPSYLTLSRDHWPFNREFIDLLPENELRAPRAAFSAVMFSKLTNLCGSRLIKIIVDVMERSNSL